MGHLYDESNLELGYNLFVEFATPIPDAPLAVGYKPAVAITFGRNKRQRSHVALFQWNANVRAAGETCGEWELVKLLSGPIAAPTSLDAKLFRVAADTARELDVLFADRYLDGERHVTPEMV